MGWRKVIHQYLSAGAADSRQMPAPTSRAKFIEEFGTPALKHREQINRTHWDNRAASQQVPPPESYTVIEESPMRIIAEVEKANLPELYCTTRFLIVKVENQWMLDDTFCTCICSGDEFLTGFASIAKERDFARTVMGEASLRCSSVS